MASRPAISRSISHGFAGLARFLRPSSGVCRLWAPSYRVPSSKPFSGYRDPLQRDFGADCRKVALGRETGDRTLDRERVTARDLSRWFGADTGDAQGLDRFRRRPSPG